MGQNKILTIFKQPQGKPNEGHNISWNDFVMDMEFSSPDLMNEAAILLVSGEFLYSDNGFMYKLITVIPVEE